MKLQSSSANWNSVPRTELDHSLMRRTFSHCSRSKYEWPAIKLWRHRTTQGKINYMMWLEVYMSLKDEKSYQFGWLRKVSKDVLLTREMEKNPFQLKDSETLLNVSSIVLSLITHRVKKESRAYSHKKLVCVPGMILLPYISSIWKCDLTQIYNQTMFDRINLHSRGKQESLNCFQTTNKDIPIWIPFKRRTSCWDLVFCYVL